MHGRRQRRRGATGALGGLAAIALVAGLLQAVALPAQAAPDDGEPAGATAVEPQVRDEIATGGTTDFWVYLRDTAELKAASAMADRAEQGQFVHEQLTGTARQSQAGLLAMLTARGVPHEAFWISNAVKVTGDEQLLRAIEQRPEVREIAADRTYELPEPAPAQQQSQVDSVEWGVDRIHAPQVWDDFEATGEGVVVGVIDSGARYDHAALVEQYRGNLGDGEFDHHYSWHDPSQVCDSPSLVPCDNSGHGTHVTGTIVGSDGGDNLIGVAPGAQWLAAKGCENRNCSQAALLSSGQFMLAPTDLQGRNPRPDLRPHIVNNSWGGGSTDDTWYESMVDAWVAAGIFPQFANGNWNNPGTAPCATASNPGNLPESYAAGAFDIDGNIASFSHRGPSAFDGIMKPNISAPGVAIRSASHNGGYETRSGTSMASPHVAGTVALLWSAAIGMERDVAATRALLDQTAVDVADLTCGGTDGNNNVWGQGQLDAFAAVDAAPRVPIGAVAGTVTDADTGDPVGHATVEISGEVDREVRTAPDGSYRTRLPAGDYTLAVSAYGFEPWSDQVSVPADDSNTVDVALAPAASITVAGQVADGSGQGWPLHAYVTVEDTPLVTYTDPLTGRYEVRVPAQGEYTLRVEPEYPGYETRTATVSAGTEDVTRDLALEVSACDEAPGYEFSGDVAVLDSSDQPLAAYLEAQDIVVERIGWGDDPTPYDVVIVNSPGYASGNPLRDVVAQTDASGTSLLFLGGQNGSGLWLLNSSIGNPATQRNGFGYSIPELYYQSVADHPVLDGFEPGDEIPFDQTSDRKPYAWFDGYQGEGAQVIALAGRSDSGPVGPGIGVQQRDNNRHVILSMHVDTGFSSTANWSEEAEQLFANSLHWLAPEPSLSCEQQDGGLVRGQVTDLNTGAGITGASVSGPDGTPAVTSAPSDPALPEGSYWRFVAAGEQELTAGAERYVATNQQVDVEPGTVGEVDFALPAGQLAVEAGSVTDELRLGSSSTHPVTVTNTGTGPAQVDLSMLPGSSEVLGADAQPTGEVRYVEGEFSPEARPAGDAAAAGVPAGAAPAAAPWTDLQNYPRSVMDSAAVELDGMLYSIGGYDGTAALSDTYAYTPRGGQWHTAANMPEPRQRAGAAAIDGKIYVVGGWPGDDTTAATTLIYDPETNSWSQGADMPEARAAAGVTVLDDMLYVVGGCTSSSCSPANSVWRYDPAADEWDTLADYPRFSAWHGCGGLAGEVYCVGGTDTQNVSNATYSYDPATDSWQQRASLPYGNWGMAYATANDQLVVNGGIVGGSATNRSAAYLPSQDVWTDVAPSNVPVYRGAGACGFYRVGGSLFQFTPVAHAERHPDLSGCTDEVDVPWLDAAPSSVTLAPDESVTVTVSLDSGKVEQPGTYATALEVGHDTPYATELINVSMVANPPNNWGKITGVVRGSGCFGAEHALDGAMVQIDGKHSETVVWTEPSGRYTYWIANKEAPLELTVSASGYLPETRRTAVRPRQETVEDFDLRALC